MKLTLAEFSSVFEKIVTGRFLEYENTLTVLNVGNLLNYVRMDSNLLNQIVVLSGSWSFIHDEKIEYLHVVHSLYFVYLAERITTADGVSV